MKFGQVEQSALEHIDFHLPPEPSSNAQILRKKQKISDCKLYLAPTGWSNAHWKGHWYPEKAKASEFLYHCSRQFAAVEYNGSQYHVPSAEQLKKWKEQVPSSFRFLPKYPLALSRSRTLGAEGLQQLFEERMLGLGEQLGPAFLQLGPSVEKSFLPELRKFVERSRLPELHIEFRHPSWFILGDDELEQFYEELGHRNFAILCTDTPGARYVLHRRLCTKNFFLRFVATGLPFYDSLRLREWAACLAEWASSGLQNIYLTLHTKDNNLNLQFIEILREIYEQKSFCIYPEPKPYTDFLPVQESLF